MKINTCLIGYGYWGKNLLRNLMESTQRANLCIAEISASKRKNLHELHPGIPVYATFEEAVAHEKIQAVVVAADTNYHYPLAKSALLLGKHTLVEKPLTTSLKEAEEIAAIAQEK